MKEKVDFKNPVSFAKHLLEFGLQTLDKYGSVELMIVAISSKDEVIPVMIEGSCLSPDEKPKTLAGISALLKSKQVKRYGVLAEGWFLDEMPPEDEAALKAGYWGKIRPSQSERRKECLHVTVCTEDGAEAGAMQEIDRDSSGKAIPGRVIMPPSKADKKGHSFGGTFTELLQ